MVESKNIKVRETVRTTGKNENGESVSILKKVNFYIDEQLYLAMKQSYEGEELIDAMTEEYAIYLDDKRYRNQIVSMDANYSNDDVEDLSMEFEDTQSESPIDYVNRIEKEELMQKAIASLSGRQAEAFFYVSTKGMTKRAASEIMGVSEQAVGQFYKQALTTLKEYIEKNN